ncbi:phage portal protein [Cupriavidus pinatubonensis]|uniref:phage portal protein n=1 Tax=Cupriavidus pinatubonensis TaxID=248026 RepID=UPI001C730556|nr:phage portal protein [Cupriavidus pinatubonensis]QYY30315.1 phage portal protein [Cupriavidus pinatubonensis]
MKMAKPAPKLTVIDRVVNYFNPAAGNRRAHARTVQAYSGAYEGGSRTKRSLKNWFAFGGSADADLIPQLAVLRNRSRDLARNNPLARGAINTMVTNVVGTGLAPQPTVDADVLGLTQEEATAWQRQAQREFALWAESKECDAALGQTFYELQNLAFRSTAENGDTFMLTPMFDRHRTRYRTRLQLIEADRCCNPQGRRDDDQFAGGVELDDFGAPIAYHFLRKHPGALGAAGAQRQWDRREAFGSGTGRRNVLHLFERRRIGMTRGEPYLAPVIDPLRQLGTYTDAELAAAVVSGMFTVFIKSGDGEGPLQPDPNQSDPDYKLGKGAVIQGAPGDSVEVINPGRPNALFDPFVQSILRQIGVALELPFEVLIKHYTSSYTAARAAILDAWRFFKMRRFWLATNFCQPVYELIIDEAVANGYLSAPGYFDHPLIRRAWLGCQWVGDAPGAIDPMKEAQASELNLKIGRTTLAKETMAYDGSNWEDNHAQQTREHAARERDGLLPTPPGQADELLAPPDNANDQ